MAVSRSLTVGNIRRAAHSLFPTRNNLFFEVKTHRLQLTVPFHQSYRLYSQYNFLNKGLTCYTFNEAKKTLWSCRNFQRFYFISATSKVSHHAQIAWKRVFHICTYNVPHLPMNRITCAVSFALSRSQLIAPGILAFLVGEFARTQSLAEAEGFYKNDLFTQDRHVYITSFIFSILELVILCLRAIYLSFLFTPCIAMAPFADSFGPNFRTAWLQCLHRTLEIAGPAFIKWGQWAASRPDLFPNDLCLELSELQTKAPAHSYAHTKHTIEKAFGRKLFEIFENFEEVPVASGSIAQVHRATLRSHHPGQKTKPKTKPIVVAVKVRHPGVSERIRRDFVLLNLFARVSGFVPSLKWLRLDESVKQFAVFMMSQVDLAREAAHLSRFIYNFRRWKDVSFPRPLYPLVHPAILVETFEDGENILRYVDEVEGDVGIKTGLAHIGTHALLKMLLVDNFIHADMHPGNILVRVTQGKVPDTGLFKSKPHVIFLDVGMTAELSKKDRLNLIDFFKAVALQDGRSAAKHTLNFSKHQTCPNPTAFIKDVEKSFMSWSREKGQSVQPAECMQELLEQVRRHRVNIDGNVCTVIVTTLVLESWQRKLDPEYNVMHTLQNILFKSDLAESLFYTIEGLMAP